MSKMNLQDMKDLFLFAKIKGNNKVSKHQAGKKEYKHNHNLSYGQKKHADFMNPANWK